MPCYKPLQAGRSKLPDSDGKYRILFNIKFPRQFESIQLPCGQCIGCRLERSRQWAVRCVHEASLHESNCFITLTFNNAHLNPEGSLVKGDFQKFMKRLRKRFGSGVRYFHCGEYGEKLARPHHHACLFNFDFPDRVHWQTRQGIALFTSEALKELWPFGFSTIGDVTFESAAYVARYVTKKITGKLAPAHYAGRLPEYVTMSRRPGIARGWIDQFKSDVYPADKVIIRGGVEAKPPRYYDSIFDLSDHEQFVKVRDRRVKLAKSSPDNTRERLDVRHEIQKRKCTFLKRGYENGSDG